MDIETFWPLDVALARGHDLTIDGKTWILSPLTLNDWGDVVKAARVEAMRAYEEGTKGLKVDPFQRSKDISTILYGSPAQDSLSLLHLPCVRHAMLKSSLRRKHPDVTDEDVRTILEGEQESRLALEIVQRLSVGPMKPDETADVDADADADADGAENPTGPPPDGTKPSETSLSDSDSPRSK